MLPQCWKKIWPDGSWRQGRNNKNGQLQAMPTAHLDFTTGSRPDAPLFQRPSCASFLWIIWIPDSLAARPDNSGSLCLGDAFAGSNEVQRCHTATVSNLCSSML